MRADTAIVSPTVNSVICATATTAPITSETKRNDREPLNLAWNVIPMLLGRKSVKLGRPEMISGDTTRAAIANAVVA